MCTDLDLPFKEILNSRTPSIASVIQIKVTAIQENLARPSFRTTQKFKTDILNLSWICTRNWVLFFFKIGQQKERSRSLKASEKEIMLGVFN